jgi:hypothetical protein
MGRMGDDAPAGFDASKPNVARVYDYLLGGKDNFEADREMARRLLEVYPATAQLAKDGRAFLGRAVLWAANQGISQFLDLGAGLPTQENTHQIVRSVDPAARVCYVDNDEMAVMHATALLAGPDGIAAARADLADTESVLANKRVQQVIDLSQPVCVIMAAVLHFYPAADARRIAQAYIGRIPSGSALVISCVHSDDPERWAVSRQNYRAATVYNHDRAELLSFFDGLEMVPPGIAPGHAWRGGMATVPAAPAGRNAYPLSGVGVKP